MAAGNNFLHKQANLHTIRQQITDLSELLRVDLHVGKNAGDVERVVREMIIEQHPPQPIVFDLEKKASYVIDMFPNVEENWIKERLTSVTVELLVEHLVNNPKDVPKKAKKIVEETKHVDANLTKGKEKKKKRYSAIKRMRTVTDAAINDYLSSDREVSDQYRIAVSKLLRNDFKEVGLDSLNKVSSHFNWHYAPTVKAIGDIVCNLDLKRSVGKSFYLNVHDASALKLQIRILKRKRADNAPTELIFPQELKDELEWCRKHLQFFTKVHSDQVTVEENFGESFYEKNVDCNICFDSFPLGEMFPCSDGHVFCRDCLQNHAREIVYGQAKATVECMEVNCGAFFGRDVLEGALNPDWIKKLDERHREEDIRRANIENLHRCKYCNYAAIIEIPVEINKVFKCGNPNCEREVCRICQVDWEEHVGIPCKEIETKDETKFRKDIEEKMALAVIRKCTSCHAELIKESGCNKLTCRCGAKMCYVCRQPDIEYNHFCAHFRSPGKPCSQCTACSLWQDTTERDEEMINAMRAEAEKKHRMLNNGARRKTIGVKDAKIEEAAVKRKAAENNFRLHVPLNHEPIPFVRVNEIPLPHHIRQHPIQQPIRVAVQQQMQPDVQRPIQYHVQQQIHAAVPHQLQAAAPYLAHQPNFPGNRQFVPAGINRLENFIFIQGAAEVNQPNARMDHGFQMLDVPNPRRGAHFPAFPVPNNAQFQPQFYQQPQIFAGNPHHQHQRQVNFQRNTRHPQQHNGHQQYNNVQPRNVQRRMDLE